MSRPISQIWTPTDTVAVAALQDLVAPGNLILNGTFSPNGDPFSFPQMTRVVSFTSANDLSGANFTINGLTSTGISVSETLVGPNNETVESVNFYNKIFSISSDSAVNGISVGSGETGHLNWLLYDYNRDAAAFLAIQVVVEGTINYTFGATLQDVSQVLDPYAFDITNSLTAQTTNQTAVALIGLQYYTTFINSSDATGSLTSYYMQQGL